MKTTEEFDKFYNLNLKSDLDFLESARLASNNKYSFKPYKRNLLVLLGLIILVVIIVKKTHWLPEKAYFIVPFCMLYALFHPIYILYKRGDNFIPINTDFKDKIINKIVRFLDPGFKYEQAKGLEKNIIDSTELFESFGFFRSDDLISGTISEHPFVLSDISATKDVVITKSQGKERDRRHVTIFKGVYAVLSFESGFQTPLYINSKKLLDNLFSPELLNTLNDLTQRQEQNSRLKNFVLTGDQTFDPLFHVRSSDPMNELPKLNAEIRKLIISAKGLTNTPIHVAFLKNEIHVAIEDTASFEMDSFTSFTNSKYVKHYFNLLNVFVGLSEGLINVIQKEKHTQ
ncbi:MAG: DUF3137 domain-containing protein [Bacteroidia bacterium]|nr:DUF3137 domain-containing protein [Bacteroidia bacterium]